MLGYIIILCIILFIILYFVSIDNMEYLFVPIYLVTGLLFSFIGAYIYDSITIDTIEVYRDNTTLKITYKDNVPIDSIVVLKNR